MFRHEHPADQGEFQFRAPLAKHVHEVAGQSVARKELGAPIDARGDKLLPARSISPVIKGHGRRKYNPNMESRIQ